MKNEERAEVAKWHSWWRIGMNIKQSLEIVAIGKAWFSEELMTKTKKSCGMLKSLRLEDPSLQLSERGCGWNSRYQKIGGFSPDLADPHLAPLSLSLLLMMVHNLKTTHEAFYTASICYNEMQLAKCNIVIGKSQFYTQFLIIECARFCSQSMWTYLYGFCKITIELCRFQNDLWEVVKKRIFYGQAYCKGRGPGLWLAWP